MRPRTEGWQIYFISEDKVVGCVGQTGLMTKSLAKIETFSENHTYCRKLAESLLCGIHPLDHLPRVSFSIKWYEEQVNAVV